MEVNSKLIPWVEYCLCESAMEIYPKIKTNSSTFRGFCKCIKEAIENDNLGKRDERVLKFMMYRATREFRVPKKELLKLCANFFLDEKWGRYIKAIELMKGVNSHLQL